MLPIWAAFPVCRNYQLTLIDIVSNFFLKFLGQVIVFIGKIIVISELPNFTIVLILIRNNNGISSIGFGYHGTICL
jgi:hypothetical protein